MKLIKWTLETKYSYHEGLFILDEKYLDWIRDKEIIVSLGEIEGKYSEVEYYMDVEDFTIVNCSEDFIKEFEKIIGEIGINPFYYMGEIKGDYEHLDLENLSILEQLEEIYEKAI